MDRLHKRAKASSDTGSWPCPSEAAAPVLSKVSDSRRIRQVAIGNVSRRPIGGRPNSRALSRHLDHSSGSRAFISSCLPIARYDKPSSIIARTPRCKPI